MSVSLFSPGLHISASEGDDISFRSETGGLLLTYTKPDWLNGFKWCVRYELPERIVLPVGVPCTVEFDRVVRASWAFNGVASEQSGKLIGLPAFSEPGLGSFAVDAQERNLVIAPFLDAESDQKVDLLAPFSFYDSRCSSSYALEFGYTQKPVGHLLHGVGSTHAVTINDVSNVPLLLNVGDTHKVSVNEAETEDDIVIASSPRMDAASVVAQIRSGFFVVDGALASGRSLWYGLRGVPYSGGRVQIRSSPSFGEKWSSGLGVPPPSVVVLDVPPAGDFCLVNLAGMHSWCCTTLQIKKNVITGVRPYPTVCSGLSEFDGARWLPNINLSRSELASRMSLRSQNGSRLCLVEPGVMDGSFRASNQLVSFCRDFVHRFTQSGLTGFVGVMPEGLSDGNTDLLYGNLRLASANTHPGSSLAVFVSNTAGDRAFAALREISSSYHRSVYALVFDGDTLVVADKFGVNLLVPSDLYPMLPVQVGRQVSIFDASAIVRRD